MEVPEVGLGYEGISTDGISIGARSAARFEGGVYCGEPTLSAVVEGEDDRRGEEEKWSASGPGRRTSAIVLFNAASTRWHYDFLTGTKVLPFPSPSRAIQQPTCVNM